MAAGPSITRLDISMFRTFALLVAVGGCWPHAHSLSLQAATPQPSEELKEFDVVIAGGSTAAFAAAVSAAEYGSKVALLEPTDWIGGQLTSSGVPAVDEAWHKLTNEDGTVSLNVAQIARHPPNVSPHLHRMLSDIGCPGKCWVSRFCFEPKSLIKSHLLPLERSLSNLTVFRETVLKQAHTDGKRIDHIIAIQRTPKNLRSGGYDRLPSADLKDWYAPKESERFRKKLIRFGTTTTIYIDATEWGELLALSNAPYLIGVESTDGAVDGNHRLGQSITYGFVQELHDTAVDRDKSVPKPNLQNLGLGDYHDREDAWEKIWTYRRLRATETEIRTGDLSLQNWGYSVNRAEGGNDYPFGYLFLDKHATTEQAGDWYGGIDLQVMAAAEQRAFAWHRWFKSSAPQRIDSRRISLNRSVLGTGHGLSKLPYIRDTRRSIGLDGFVLKVADLQPESSGNLANRFTDRIALGAYPVDIHPLAEQKYPAYIYEHYEIAPFTIPFRSLTNDRFENMLVAGKTMAQSFLANSATRLHPTEWSSGTAAGVAAARMAKTGVSARAMLESIADLQTDVKVKTPIDWTIPD